MYFNRCDCWIAATYKLITYNELVLAFNQKLSSLINVDNVLGRSAKNGWFYICWSRYSTYVGRFFTHVVNVKSYGSLPLSNISGFVNIKQALN